MRHALLTGLVAACLAAGPGAARADDGPSTDHALKEAQAELAAGRYERAWPLYQRLADKHPLAQFVIGQFHQQGWGRPADPVMACRWFEKAAGHGVPYAEHLWADCLAQGIGRTADIPAALIWYERAARDGHAWSLCAAAAFFISGQGVARDTARGIAMCTQAAQADSSPAMLQLALYLDGEAGVPTQAEGARYWFEQAARRGMPQAQYRLGLMQAEGRGGPVDREAALWWLESAASAGHAPAYLPTAILYGNGPIDETTHALPATHLAKAYLWTAAAIASHHHDPSELRRARDIESQVLAVMPTTWRPALDRQVAAHLARFASSR